MCETSDENSYPPEYTDEKLIEPKPDINIELPPEPPLEEWACYHNNYQTNLKNIPTEETTGLLEFTCLDCGYNKNHILKI